jgi:hypothetical protein
VKEDLLRFLFLDGHLVPERAVDETVARPAQGDEVPCDVVDEPSSVSDVVEVAALVRGSAPAAPPPVSVQDFLAELRVEPFVP